MRLAFFVVKFPVASETFITDQVASMLALGHDVTIITVEQGDAAPDLRVAAAKIVVLRAALGKARAVAELIMLPFRGRDGRRRLAAALRAVFCGLRESAIDLAAYSGKPLGRFDAVICHFGPAGVRASALRRGGVLDGPICTVFHGYDVSKHTVLRRFLPHYRRLFRDTELFLPVSDLWRSRLLSWGAPPERVLVQHMGVDLDRMAQQSSAKVLNRPLRVLSVGRMVEKKGLNHAVEGVRLCGVPVQYTIIGFGPQESALLEQAKGSSNKIRFLGRQPHSAVFAELSRSDVFLLPSITGADGNMEGIPVALMEAMAAGVITVATRHSANAELIVDGKEGLLVDEGDGAAIGAILERIARGDFDIASMRRAARRKIESEFNNATLNLNLQHVLSEVATANIKTLV